MRGTTAVALIFGLVLPTVLAVVSCGSTPGIGADGGLPDVRRGDGGPGDSGLHLGDSGDATDGGSVMFEDASFTAPDCPGCTFPPMKAPSCAAGTPAINVVYPSDGVLVPPNMNVISVMWTPYGTPFTEFEVDFENAVTDMRVVTKCAMQTMDTEQPSKASGGCELILDVPMWDFLSKQNRGGDPVTITVRGTTDGKCANKSTDSVNMSFAEDEMLGAIYYWKSTVTSSGVGGQVWVKSFGDSKPESLVTGSLGGTCNGCHALSRDGVRMFIDSDDDDSDDEYSDVGASLIDMVTLKPLPGGGGRGNLGPGFGTWSADHTEFMESNGLFDQNPPTNVFFLYDGVAGAKQKTVTLAGMSFVTMPDWSPDGKRVVYVEPGATASWTNSHGTPLNDDDHVFGGSLYTIAYSGSQTFGTISPLLKSAGENNYYPSYSPDGLLVVFNRVALDTSVAKVNDCKATGTPPNRLCPNDSFSNPAARIMVMPASGGTPVDLAAANGSPLASAVPLSNSWPKWSPFLQNYKGDKLLWLAFSTTRDYGLRVRNHQPGMVQCYPADSYEDPGADHGQPFHSNCEQPQLWMAAVDVTKAAKGGVDPSRTAFWLPFQDMTTHNHTPQWTQAVAAPPADAGACTPSGGSCATNPSGCCAGTVCQADGTCGNVVK